MCLSNNTDFPNAELYLESQGVDLSVPYALRSFVKNAAKQGNTGVVSALLPHLDDFTKNKALVRAAFGGHVQLIHLLLKSGANPLYNDSEALRVAVKHSHEGSLACIQALIPVSNPFAKGSNALVRASKLEKNIEILKLLAPVSDNHKEALENASWFGCLENMEFLLSYGQCGDDQSKALSWAIYQSIKKKEEGAQIVYDNIIAKLWPLSNIENLDKYILDEAFLHRNQKWIDFFWPRFLAELQNKEIDKDFVYWTASCAAASGYVGFLQEILPYINTNDWDDYAIRTAAEHNQWECVKILMAHTPPTASCWERIAIWAITYGKIHLFEELKIPIDRHTSLCKYWSQLGERASSNHVQDVLKHHSVKSGFYLLFNLLHKNKNELIRELLEEMPEILEDHEIRTEIVKLNHRFAISIYQKKFPHDPYWSEFIKASLEHSNFEMLNYFLNKYPNRWSENWVYLAMRLENDHPQKNPCFARLIEGQEWDDNSECWILKLIESGFLHVVHSSALQRWIKDDVKLKKLAYSIIQYAKYFKDMPQETEMILNEAFLKWSDEEKHHWCQLVFKYGKSEALPFLQKQKENQSFWKKIYDFLRGLRFRGGTRIKSMIFSFQHAMSFMMILFFSVGLSEIPIWLWNGLNIMIPKKTGLIFF